jgi:hypothetical protein
LTLNGGEAIVAKFEKLGNRKQRESQKATKDGNTTREELASNHSWRHEGSVALRRF